MYETEMAGRYSGRMGFQSSRRKGHGKGPCQVNGIEVAPIFLGSESAHLKQARDMHYKSHIGFNAPNMMGRLGDHVFVCEVEGLGAAASQTRRRSEAGLGGDTAEQRPAMPPDDPTTIAQPPAGKASKLLLLLCMLLLRRPAPGGLR